MAVEGWLIALVAGVTVVQLLVYHYLRDRFDTTAFADRAADIAPGGGTPPPESEGGDRSVPDGASLCPSCGALNRGDFSYCKDCLTRLGA